MRQIETFRGEEAEEGWEEVVCEEFGDDTPGEDAEDAEDHFEEGETSEEQGHEGGGEGGGGGHDTVCEFGMWKGEE